LRKTWKSFLGDCRCIPQMCSLKKSFLVTPLLLFYVQVGFCQKGAVAIGFNWELLSRGGYTIGYFVSNNLSIEAHLGGVPHVATWGLSAKYKPSSEHPSLNLIFGVANVTFFGHVRDDSLGKKFYNNVSIYGLNLGFGKEINFRNPRWKMPVELGIFRGFYLSAKRIEMETRKSKTVKLPKQDMLSWSGFAGFGAIWYSHD